MQNFHASTHVTTVAGATQTIPGGPVASQLSIKQLGTNGGGFFNTNSAHPFENPNGFTNMIEMFFLVMIPFAATYALGVLVKGKKFGWVIFGVDVPADDALDRRRGRRRDARQPAAEPGRRHPDRDRHATRRQHGGQGGPLRPDRLRHVGRRDDRFVERLGQLVPRQLHADRRARAAHEPPARRGHAGRARRRSHRHARARDPHGVHRGPHGRAERRSSSARRSRPPR